jgi:tetratricopeptide (TPR) repeat protein
MSAFFRQMVAAIDLRKEDARLQPVQFDRDAPSRIVRAPQMVQEEEAKPALSGAAKTLDDAEKLYTARDLDKAKQLYLAALQQTDQKPMQASAYYGLARIATLQKDPETAVRLFEKTLELEPEAQVKAWALVYLGQLELAAGEKGQAGKYFQQALQVTGASDLARQRAHQGIQLSGAK